MFLINPYRFGALLWTPANITTALWLDASDASTITTVSGAVLQWNDKSGSARNVTQATVANRPVVTSAGLGGKDVITFNGINNVLTTALSTGLSSSFAVFTVVMPLRNQAVEGYVTSEVSSYSNYWFLLGRAGVSPGQKMGIDLFDGANNPGSNFATLPTLGQGYIMAGVRDTAASPRKLFYYQDETLVGDVTDTTSLTAPVYSALHIGGQVNQPNRYGNVRVAEVVIIPSLPSTTVRQQMSGYLAHKWGLTGSLPAGHPYKTTAPTV